MERSGRSKLRIAQVAPLVESVPPKHYGGTERIVAYLTEELVRLGHKVTLFASGDSVTSAELGSCMPAFISAKQACYGLFVARSPAHGPCNAARR